LTPEDIDEISRLVRSKWYWPRLLFANLYGIFILGGLLWITVVGLVNGDKLNWRGIEAVWAIFVVLFAFLYFRAKQARKKEIAAMAAGPNGASSYQPWVSYKRWHEGKRTVVVDYATHKGFAMLPLSGLAESERQVLRGLLDSHLGINSKDV